MKEGLNKHGQDMQRIAQDMFPGEAADEVRQPGLVCSNLAPLALREAHRAHCTTQT
jgi:hypothetical protein